MKTSSYLRGFCSALLSVAVMFLTALMPSAAFASGSGYNTSPPPGVPLSVSGVGSANLPKAGELICFYVDAEPFPGLLEAHNSDHDNPALQSLAVFEIYALPRQDGAVALVYHRRETPSLFDIEALVALNRASVLAVKRSSDHRVQRFEVTLTKARV